MGPNLIHSIWGSRVKWHPSFFVFLFLFFFIQEKVNHHMLPISDTFCQENSNQRKIFLIQENISVQEQRKETREADCSK